MSCARRLKSHPSSKLRAQKIALLMGGTLSKTEINGFQQTFTVLSLAHLLRQRGPKCWLCGKSDHVAAGLTVQQSTRLALLSITWWALGSKNSTRLRGLWGKVPKTLPPGSPKAMGSFTLSSTRFHEDGLRGSPGPGRGPVAPSGPDCTAGARSAPIAHSRPNRGPTQSGPVNCTKLASPSFARYTQNFLGH